MCDKVNFRLTSAIRDGNLERVTELVDFFGFSDCESEGYLLLVEAIRHRHTEIAKLLLIYGCNINSKNREKRNANTPLGLAITNGYAEIVEMLLHRGADIHDKDTHGSTVLHTAVERGHRKIVKLLLNHGADVRVLNNNGVNPLHLACKKQYVQIAEDLLNHGAYINSVCISTSKLGYTPLHFSSEQGFKEAVKLFLSKGADVGATTWDNLTPLHIAVKAERKAVVKLLLEHGAKVDAQDKNGNTVLHLAVEIGNSTIVEEVLKYCPAINNQSNRSSFKNAVCGSREIYAEIVDSLLRYGFIANPEDVDSPELMCNALAKGYLKIIEDLLKNGIDVNMLDNSVSVSGDTLLHSAAMNKQDEVAKILINHGANVNAKNDWEISPVFYAVHNSDVKLTRLLLTNGAEIKDSPELLRIAAANGHLEIVEELLKFGADVNALDHSEYGSSGTPLHREVMLHQREAAKLLVNYGANVNVKDKTGRTPVFYAVQNNDAEIAKLLLNNGADIKDSPELLYIAAANGHLEIVENLLKRGADVNMIDRSKYGGTSLHSAVRKKREEVSKLLVNYGADVNAKDESGKTPVFYAVENNDVKIIRLLLTNGANVKDRSELLHMATASGHLEIMEDLLKYGTDVNMLDHSDYGIVGTPLHSAVRKKREEVSKLLVNYGADVNAKDERGKTPVFYAVENCDVKIIRLLLTNGADIKDSSELLHSVADYRCLEILEDLLKRSDDLKLLVHSEYGRGGTSLLSAVTKNREEVAKLLVDYGANVNAKDERGKTPLFYAVKNNNVEIAKLLLTSGANIKDSSELLHIAAANGHLGIVEDILKCGADVNSLDHSKYGRGGTPLHSAVRENRKDIAKLFVNYGANVNAKDVRGKPSIYYAVEDCDAKITRLLLTNGADIKGNPELLYIAIEKKCAEIVDALLKHGANVNFVIKYGTPLEVAISEENSMSDEDDDDDYDSDCYDEFDRENKNFRIRASTEIVELLRRHIAKLQVAGLYVHKRNLKSMNNDYEIINFQRECGKEIEIMKCEKISNSYVSFYDIFTKNENQLAVYANNENIVQAIKSSDYKTKFPIYASMIEGKFRKALERKELIEQGNQLFRSLFDSLPELPLPCIEKIFSYLSIYDIKLLIHA